MKSLGTAPSHPAGSPVRRRAGFTLIEILVVVAVIVILAGIVVVIGVGVMSSAKEKSTRATMDKLDSAMIEYLKNNPEPGPGATSYVAALQSFPSSASVINGSVTGGVIKDGWGNAIQYLPSKSPPKALPFGAFWSYGRDGQANTADDIFSKGAAAQP